MSKDLKICLEKDPKIHPSTFIGAGCQIMGDVEIGEDCSIWYNSVARGAYISVKDAHA